MRRILIVANQTLGGDQVLETVRARLSAGACHFHVLVPATNAAQLDPGYLAESMATDQPAAPDSPAAEVREDPGHPLARLQLRHELERLRAEGVDASGEIGVSDPMDAIRTALRREPFDEIILSTLPPGLSRWIAMDLPSRARRAFKLPVTHVSGLARQP